MPFPCSSSAFGRHGPAILAALLLVAALTGADATVPMPVTGAWTTTGATVTVPPGTITGTGNLLVMPSVRAVLQTGLVVQSGGRLTVRFDQAPTIASLTIDPWGSATTSVARVTASDPESGTTGLTYVWSVAPADGNLDIASQGATANLTALAAGTWTVQVQVLDPQGMVATASAVTTVVAATRTLVIDPQATSLCVGATAAFAATVLDQFGEVVEPLPTFSWSVPVGSGTIAANGVYSAPATTGSALVVASAGGLSATAAVTITSVLPTVASAVYACPSDTLVVQKALQTTSPGGAPLQFSLSSTPGHGAVTWPSTGTFRYVPQSNYVGIDTFTVLATTGSATSAPATIVIGVGVDAERMTLLRSQAQLGFDPVRWVTDAKYRLDYLTMIIPGRVWLAAASGSASRPLRSTGASIITVSKGGSVSIGIKASPFAPVSGLALGGGLFSNGGKAVTTQVGANGIATFVFSAPAVTGRCPVVFGSPIMSGAQRIVIEVVP